MDDSAHLAVLFAAVVAVIAVLSTLATYNGVKGLRSDVRDAWAGMDRQLVRRYELLSPLVSSARATGGAMPDALSRAMAARNRAAVAFSPEQLAEAEAALTASLAELFAAPPAALAAHPSYARCRTDLSAAASRIVDAGEQYNAAVSTYNVALRSFPQDWAAAAFGFKPQPMFGVVPAELR